MSNEQLLTIIGILSAPSFGVIILRILDWRKSKAETKNIRITGEKDASELYKQFAIDQKKDRDDLRRELREEIRKLKSDHMEEIKQMQNEFARVTKEKDDKIIELEGRVRELEKELEKYKTTAPAAIDTAKEVLHASVDVVAEKIKSDLAK